MWSRTPCMTKLLVLTWLQIRAQYRCVMHENVNKYGTSYKLGEYLNAVIDCVFEETYFSNADNQGVENRIVPDNTVELIITDKSFKRKFAGKKDAVSLGSHFSGLKTTWQDISLQGSPLISLRFKPEKIFQITKIPAYEFKNQCLSPTDVFGNHFEGFEELLFSQKNTITRLRLIHDFFSRRLVGRNKLDDALFQVAKTIIEKNKGNIRLKNLCVELNVSQKTLENKFKLFLGATPKEYCRLIRFISSVKRFISSKINLSELTYESHFFDQSHLIREFNNFTGCSPKAFLSSSLGIQEDIFKVRFFTIFAQNQTSTLLEKSNDKSGFSWFPFIHK